MSWSEPQLNPLNRNTILLLALWLRSRERILVTFLLTDISLRLYWIRALSNPPLPSPKTVTTQTDPCAIPKGNGPGHTVAGLEPPVRALNSSFMQPHHWLCTCPTHSSAADVIDGRPSQDHGSKSFSISPSQKKMVSYCPRSVQDVQPKEPCGSEGGEGVVWSPSAEHHEVWGVWGALPNSPLIPL